MRLVKDYMNNEKLRHELNTLTRTTFGFDFENWVTSGYFEGDYIPYSFEENDKIISNVSANVMKFEQNGRIRNYIQLGTVMTDENYRNKGLARELMEVVIKEYEGNCDGIYLFGDLSAVDFYKKLGFKEKNQYRYTLTKGLFRNTNRNDFVQVVSTDTEVKNRYEESVKKSISYGAFEQINKYGLQMFYTSGLKDVYYSNLLDCFVVFGKKGDTIEIKSVICNQYIPIEQIVGEIGMEYENLQLGFTPRKEELDLFECTIFDGEDDYRLFCRGEKLDSIEDEKLYFPTFSHA